MAALEAAGWLTKEANGASGRIEAHHSVSRRSCITVPGTLPLDANPITLTVLPLCCSALILSYENLGVISESGIFTMVI